MTKTLDNLLADIATEVTEEQVLAAQSNLQEQTEDQSIKMLWRMYAADPIEA